MTTPSRVTVAQAVILTGRSKTVIYDIISSGAVRTEESSDGILVDLAQLRTQIAGRRNGRPRGSAKRQ